MITNRVEKVPMQHARFAIRDMDDIEVVELNPLTSYCSAHSSYEALQNASFQFPGKTALRYFIDGHCHNPRRIPLRARVKAAAAFVRYRGPVATPYEEHSFRQVFERVTKTARLFQNCGIGRNDVVSLLLPNLPETLFCMWAAETVGVLNPINPLLEPDIIQNILIAANTRVLVTLGGLPGSDIWEKVERIRHGVPSLKFIIIVKGDVPSDCVRYASAIARISAQPLPQEQWPQSHEVASLFHTGGTTGLPKLVRGTHRNKIANANMLILTSPLSHDDVGLIALPMFHVNAAVNCLLALLLGMTTVIAGPAGFRTAGVRENFLKILHVQRISYFSAVPTIFAALLQEPGIEEDLSCVRFAISAAAALPLEVMRIFTERTGIPILEGYGQTEATVASCLTPYSGTRKPGSVGLPLPFARMKTAILSPSNAYLRDCGLNEIGQLLISGDHVSAGYLNPQHDKELWVHDSDGTRWLNSGDLARIDEDGYVWLTGRSKELIIRGGHNIDPRMIEEALQSHPDVMTAAAVGQPDPQSGEVPVAYVTLIADSTVDADKLLQFAAREIPERAAWPKAIRIVDELPLTAIGKVFKPKLIQQEHEIVFRQALQPLQAWLSSLKIEVKPHSEYGLLTTIQVVPNDDHDRELITGMAADAMRPYVSRYSLSFSDAAQFGRNPSSRHAGQSQEIEQVS